MNAVTGWAAPPKCLTCNDSRLVEVGHDTIACPEWHGVERVRQVASRVTPVWRVLAVVAAAYAAILLLALLVGAVTS